jgi:glycerol-3-phosphate dehydrogenase
MSRPRVIVVGGGGTGAALAWDLSLRGVGVTLLERGELTSGTTGRHHGQLHCGARYAVGDPRIARECLRESETLRRIAAASIEFNYGLFVALEEAEERFGELFLSACAACGIPTRILKPAQALAMEPNLTPRLRLAVLVPDGSMDAFRLVLQFAAAARARGADLRTFAEVTDLLVNRSGGPGATPHVHGARVRDLREERGYDLEADLVLNAAGAWSGEIAALAGARVSVRPSPGTMVAVKGRLSNMVVSRLRPPGDGDIIVPQRNLTIIGSTEWLAEDPDVAPPRAGDLEHLTSLAAEMLPSFSGAPVHAVWSAVRPLVGAGDESALRSLSRDFVVIDHAEHDGIEGLVSIVGGKATTLRAMAEAAADLACCKLGLALPCRTAAIVLPPARSYYDPSRRPVPPPRRPPAAPAPRDGALDRAAAAGASPEPRKPNGGRRGTSRVGPPGTGRKEQEREIIFRVSRARPGATAPIRFEETRLVVGPETTVLDVLDLLRSSVPGFMHRHSCHHGSCGTCACRINGRERLACTTRVLELDSAMVTLEPLRGFPLQGDLAVDPTGFFREFPRGLGSLRSSEWLPQGRPPEELSVYTRLESCIECGACVSACPVDDFLGPAALAAINRERQNHPESAGRMKEIAATDRGVRRCSRALECSRVCPAGVYPARHIEELRRLLHPPH